MPTKTTRSEMKGFAQKKAPPGNSTLVGYKYLASDAFLQNVLSQKLLTDEIAQVAGGKLLDGSSNANDDSYRRAGVQTVSRIVDGVEQRRNRFSLARQISTKPDQEAVIRVVARINKHRSDSSKQNKSVAPLVNVVPPYTKFFLESVGEDRMEKAQVIETFGEFIAFFFGRRPEVYQFKGRLLNTRNHDWKNDWQEIYENFLRGTKAVENNATVLIQYDDVIAEGFLMGTHVEYHGVTNNECPFNFTMLVTNRAPIHQIQRLKDRRARGRFSAAEQQIINNLNQIRSSNVPFALMQQALSSKGLSTSDVALVTTANNKVKPSNPTTSATAPTSINPPEDTGSVSDVDKALDALFSSKDVI
jgi:hypothetical protein